MNLPTIPFFQSETAEFNTKTLGQGLAAGVKFMQMHVYGNIPKDNKSNETARDPE